MNKIFIICFSLCFFSFVSKGDSIKDSDTTVVYKIWDNAPYNSFTDLIRYKGKFYCSFREGRNHVNDNDYGKVRILKSKDGKKWTSVGLLEIDGVDLRDPKLSVTPNHQIMVVMAGAIFKNGRAKELYPMKSFSDRRGEHFSSPTKVSLDSSIMPSLDWTWRITWNGDYGYAIDYQLRYTGGGDRLSSLYLMRTKEGNYFSKISKLDVNGFPNESTIRFDSDNRAYVLIRRDAGDKRGILAHSDPPYIDWNFQQLNYQLGGPNFLFLDKNKLLIGTRWYEEKEAITVILVTDLNGRILNKIELPSGGDNSYTGMVLYKDQLWVSYYSSHEGKPSIYIAKIPISNIQNMYLQ